MLSYLTDIVRTLESKAKELSYLSLKKKLSAATHSPLPAKLHFSKVLEHFVALIKIKENQEVYGKLRN